MKRVIFAAKTRSNKASDILDYFYQKQLLLPKRYTIEDVEQAIRQYTNNFNLDSDCIQFYSNCRKLAMFLEEILFRQGYECSYYPSRDGWQTFEFEKDKSYSIPWESKSLYQKIKFIRYYLKNYSGTRVFEDFADTVGQDVADVIDVFADAESRGFLEIPEDIQVDSEYANADLYE